VQANSLKDHFVTRASDELRTPLTTIQGQAQLALRRLNRPQVAIEPKSLQKHFENIDKKARHMKVLIEDLMNLSGLCSDTMPLHLTSCRSGSPDSPQVLAQEKFLRAFSITAK